MKQVKISDEQFYTLAKLAWDFLWKDNLERRNNGYDFEGNTYHISATDLGHQIRVLVDEQSEGRELYSTGRGTGYYQTTIRGLTHGLAYQCRKWLLANVELGNIDAHNFDKHHISRMRFRPKGAPLSPAESKTLEAKKKRESKDTPMHLVDPEIRSWPYKTLCSREARKHLKSIGYRQRKAIPGVRFTKNRLEVTCPRCLSSIQRLAEAEPSQST
jgi:hypothetical protein